MKSKRHNKILELIEEKDIETQEEICAYLRQSGFDVTQATVSRDIRELKLIKVGAANGKQKYSRIHLEKLKKTDKLKTVFKDYVTKIDCAQNMVVIKTIEGMGMAVCVALDNMDNGDILGTIAGDDTVFCVVRTTETAQEIVSALYSIINA